MAGLLLAACPVLGDVTEHLRAARAAEARGDFAAAETAYQQAVALREDADTYQRLGLVRHLQNKFAQAIPALEKAVRLNPALWGAQLFLGIDCYRTNQFDKALPALTRALELRPRDAETRFWLGATHLARKEYLDGLEMLEELERERSGNLEVLRLLAQNYSDFATALHNKLAAEHPDSAWARLVHAQALESEGFREAALEQYRAALRMEPELVEAREAVQRLSK